MKNALLLISLITFMATGCSHGGKRYWKKMDANGDGAVSKAEFDKSHEKKWAKMDSDGDGMVTWDEKKSYKRAKKTGKKTSCGCGHE